MDAKQAYNTWASQYDTDINKTRDLEGLALRESLASIPFDSCLEIGCGTGKNTAWLIQRSQHITAVDLSEEMLARAKEKINSEKVQFEQADIRTAWTFRNRLFDLVSFSLVLEHIENLDPVIRQAAESLNPGGYIYIGELHPFKQYTGSKARFDNLNGQMVVECFDHHISDFLRIAKKHGLVLVNLEEYFDNIDRKEIPRILTILFHKPGI